MTCKPLFGSKVRTDYNKTASLCGYFGLSRPEVFIGRVFAASDGLSSFECQARGSATSNTSWY